MVRAPSFEEEAPRSGGAGRGEPSGERASGPAAAGGEGDGGGTTARAVGEGSGGDRAGQPPAGEEVSPQHQQQPQQKQQLQHVSDWRRWGRVQNSATSGLGFMSALQRAIILEQQHHPQQEKEAAGGAGGRAGGGDGGGDGGAPAAGDEHALELLSTIAACCEVRAVVVQRAVSVEPVLVRWIVLSFVCSIRPAAKTADIVLD